MGSWELDSSFLLPSSSHPPSFPSFLPFNEHFLGIPQFRCCIRCYGDRMHSGSLPAYWESSILQSRSFPETWNMGRVSCVHLHLQRRDLHPPIPSEIAVKERWCRSWRHSIGVSFPPRSDSSLTPRNHHGINVNSVDSGGILPGSKCGSFHFS